MNAINQVTVDRPVAIGDVILSNLLELGVDVIATSSVLRELWIIPWKSCRMNGLFTRQLVFCFPRRRWMRLVCANTYLCPQKTQKRLCSGLIIAGFSLDFRSKVRKKRPKCEIKWINSKKLDESGGGRPTLLGFFCLICMGGSFSKASPADKAVLFQASSPNLHKRISTHYLTVLTKVL